MGVDVRVGDGLGWLPRRILSLVVAIACLTLAGTLPPQAASSQNPDRLRDELGAEHRDRKERLARLGRERLVGTPQLYEALVRRAELPASIGADVPVLRAVFPQQVFFDTDKVALLPAAETVADVVAQALKDETGEVAVFVAGHTDSRADDAYNLDLSIRRAESVARALQARAVKAKVWRIGFGRAVPLVPNTSDANMARNRRVEFIIAHRPEAVAAWLAKQEVLICAGADPQARSACRQSLVGAPAFEAVAVGRDGEPAGQSMPVTVRTSAVRPPRAKPPVAVRLESPAPVPVDLGERPVYVRRPDL